MVAATNYSINSTLENTGLCTRTSKVVSAAGALQSPPARALAQPSLSLRSHRSGEILRQPFTRVLSGPLLTMAATTPAFQWPASHPVLCTWPWPLRGDLSNLCGLFRACTSGLVSQLHERHEGWVLAITPERMWIAW